MGQVRSRVDKRYPPHRPYLRLAKFERLSGHRADTDGLTMFLSDAARLATRITMSDGCCEISLPGAEGDSPVRVSSDGYAAMLGTIQDQLGEGPCLDVLATTRSCYAADFRVERRWSVFTLAARLHGFCSVLVQPLMDRSGAVIGTLSLYARHPDAYPDTDRGQIADLADIVGEVVSRPRSDLRAERSPTEPRVELASGSSRMVHDNPAVEFELTRTDHEGVVVVAVAGDVDLATSPWLRHQLLRMLWGRPTRLVVALERVEFMDAAGLAAMAVIGRYARLVGTRFGIAGPRRFVRKMLTLTGLDKAFEVFPNLADALADEFTDELTNGSDDL